MPRTKRERSLPHREKSTVSRSSPTICRVSSIPLFYPTIAKIRAFAPAQILFVKDCRMVAEKRYAMRGFLLCLFVLVVIPQAFAQTDEPAWAKRVTWPVPQLP